VHPDKTALRERRSNRKGFRLNLNTRTFNKIVLASSCICGLVLSAFIGIWTYRQASPNFDSKDAISTIKAFLENTATGSVAKAGAIGQNLSAYNRKVANSRLLVRYGGQDLSKLSDPELLSLKEHYKETAVKPFAIREYGILAAIGVAAFSTGLTITTTWMIIWGIGIAITRQKGMLSFKQEMA
jgi:hypothetical protein